MQAIVEQITAAHQASLESSMSLVNSSLDRAERLAKLNLSIARTCFEDSVINFKTVLCARNMGELTNLQSAIDQPAMEKLITYANSVFEIVAEAREETSRVLAGKLAASGKHIATTFDSVAKTYPAGSDYIVAAMKTAIIAVNPNSDSLEQIDKSLAVSNRIKPAASKARKVA